MSTLNDTNADAKNNTETYAASDKEPTFNFTNETSQKSTES